MRFERELTAIDPSSNTLTFDAPVMLSLDVRHATSLVTKIEERRISHVGVEHIRFDSVYDASEVRA